MEPRSGSQGSRLAQPCSKIKSGQKGAEKATLGSTELLASRSHAQTTCPEETGTQLPCSSRHESGELALTSFLVQPPLQAPCIQLSNHISFALQIFLILFCSVQTLSCGMWYLVPQPRIKSGPLVVRTRSPNHWLCCVSYSAMSDSL